MAKTRLAPNVNEMYDTLIERPSTQSQRRFLAVSDIYPMFIEHTITWVSLGFSGYIWLDTKNCVIDFRRSAYHLVVWCQLVELSSLVERFEGAFLCKLRHLDEERCKWPFSEKRSEHQRSHHQRSRQRKRWRQRRQHRAHSFKLMFG